MYVNDTGLEPSQSFAYEVKGDSAVILRCFSRDTRAEIPEYMEGYRVTELAPYAFSAHMDEKAFQKGIQDGKIKIFVPKLMQQMGEAVLSNADRQLTGTEDLADTDALQNRSRNKCQAAAGKLPTGVPALAGDRLEEITLPDAIHRVGRYCFYNCANLRKLTFHGGLQDWGAGAFTGCHHINEMCVTADQENKSSLKQVLDEIHEEVTVTYYTADGQCAQLVFPEFFEEGVENTPARILEEKIHGSGMMYRNCIVSRKMDFVQYDTRLSHAIYLESQNMVARLVMGRLRYPCELSQKAREKYETYVRENGTAFADLFIEKKDLDGIRWLLGLYMQTGAEQGRPEKMQIVGSISDGQQEKMQIAGAALNGQQEKMQIAGAISDEQQEARDALLGYITEAATRNHFTEATGYLMNFGHKQKKAARRRMEL